VSDQVQRAPTPLARKAFALATRETGVTSAELRRVDHTIGWKAYLQRMGGTYGYAFRMSKDGNITRYWLTGGPP
jgi:hypothetical protein